MSDGNDTFNLDDDIMARMLVEFQKEARDHLDHLNLFLIQLEEDPKDDKLINRVFRVAHTIKGSAAFAGLTEVSDIGRKIEDLIGEVRKGAIPLSQTIINTLFEGIDVLTELLDAAHESRKHRVPVVQYSAKLGALMGGEAVVEDEEIEMEALPEIAAFYKEAYDQLATLKHLVYSSTHLTDEETLAVLFSKQIFERMAPDKNCIWLVQNGKRVSEIARNGKLVPSSERRLLDIESSDVLRRVINDQLTVWPTSLPSVKELLPDYESPTLFPLKTQNQAFGFLGLDPEESTEVDAFQFVGQFAAMMLNISKLHRQVSEQKHELDEMTQILFRQNTQLSSLYHVELELMGATEPEQLCAILVTSLVNDLEVSKAAVFLIDHANNQFTFSAESGLPGVRELEFPLNGDNPLQQSLRTSRIVSSADSAKPFEFGGQAMGNWIVLGLKGRESIQGMLVVEFDNDDLTDPISILTNYTGILLENLKLQQSFKQTEH